MSQNVIQMLIDNYLMTVVFRDITQSVGDLQNGLVKTQTGIYIIVDFDVDGYINVNKRFFLRLY